MGFFAKFCLAFVSREDDLALQIAVQRGKQAELSAQAPGPKMAAHQGEPE